MQVQLTPKEQARLARSQRTNSEAYDLYLRALVHVGLENRQDNQAAVELREQAVARDPKFAPAYAALGREYRTKAFIVDPKGKQWEEKARARSVVQVHPGPPFKSPVNTRQFSLFPFPWIFLKKPICQLFANFRIGQRTQCREIHGVDLLVATVRPRFQPPPKARYSPTRLAVTDV